MALKIVWAYVGLITLGMLGGIVYIRVEDRGLVGGILSLIAFFLFIWFITVRAFAKKKAESNPD